MAAQTCVKAQHATLSGTTADSVTFSRSWQEIQIRNRSGSADLFVTYGVDTVPVALADDTAIVPPGGDLWICSDAPIVVVRIVGDGNAYSAVGHPKGTKSTGSGGLSTVVAGLSTSTLYNGTTPETPLFAVIDHASSGDNTVVAADADEKIRVHQVLLVAAGTVNVRFESAAGGTALTGVINLVANVGFVLPFSPIGWFETAANQLLNLELSGAVSVDGVLAYTLI